MAASFHQGFSDHRAEFDIEVGHYLGLRWFHLSRIQHGVDSVSYSIGGPAKAKCWCGDTSEGSMDSLPDWMARHGKPRYDVRLSGARDNWHKGENVAKCLTYGQEHAVPAERCGCGFWAYWALGEKQVRLPAVAGIIKGYGEVIEGELGFRASHAKIAALFPLVYSTELALALEDTYGADVFHSFQAMLEMNPAPAGQPYLSDAYFSRRREIQEPPKPSYKYKPSPTHSRMADALKAGAVPCMKCGLVVCAHGQAKCIWCEITDLTA
jgi:hypothetical protein